MDELIMYIEWEGPFRQEEIRQGEQANKFGLYQIYGNHPVYGDNCLLYIGKTLDSFKTRLSESRGILNNSADTNNLQIYIGRVFYDEASDKIDNDTLKKHIEYAETILINYHAPAYNSSNINSFKHYEKYIRVINTGSYRRLVPELSTLGLYHDYKIKVKIDKLAKLFFGNTKKMYDKDNGYGFWVKDDIWFGVDYKLWSYDTVLVLKSRDKDVLLKISKDIENFSDENELWYYVKIFGNESEIIDKLKLLK